MAEPDEYHKSGALKLYFKTKTDCSLDEAGALKYKKDKKKANTHGTWVKQVQGDLIVLGYLKAGSDDGHYGGGTDRGMKRFQRHAKRAYRMGDDKKPVALPAGEVFAGNADGICDPATAKEIRKWVDKKWANPVGWFKLKDLRPGLSGKLREDAADAWLAIVDHVDKAGGILIGPYGDTLRPFRKTDKVGTSYYSVHYVGRAVDICQELAGPHGITFEHKGFAPAKKDGETEEQTKARTNKEALAKRYAAIDKHNESRFVKEREVKGHGKVKTTGRRYFVVKDGDGKDMYWRIFCLHEDQSKKEGTFIKKGDKKWYDFGSGKETGFLEGYYIDLTKEIESTGKFTRIKSQSGWESSYNKTEWWHFAYKVDLQETFQDEAELIGITEKELDEKGWNTDTKKDHKPG